MYLGIYDNITIQNLKLKGTKPLLIRVLEPSYLKSSIPYGIKNINEYVDILELYFDDIINQNIQKSSDYIYFSKDMAKSLNVFILKNDFDEIAVHCSAGISRSPAIGLCISKILDNKSIENEIINYSHFIPNKQVLEVFNSFNYVKKIVSKEIVFRNPEIYHFNDASKDLIDFLDYDER